MRCVLAADKYGLLLTALEIICCMVYYFFYYKLFYDKWRRDVGFATVAQFIFKVDKSMLVLCFAILVSVYD